jgi:gamma-glutamylcyclotransferase (GGCT)/AIG2-like uncharacterized protein YtfP
MPGNGAKNRNRVSGGNAMPYLFAHGQLRQGSRSQAMMADSELVGAAETDEAYALFTINDKAVLTRRPVSKIRGDLYSVTEDKLVMIDRFEGHPRICNRELVPIKLDDGKIIEAWAYFYIQPLHNSVLLDNGDYLKHHS